VNIFSHFVASFSSSVVILESKQIHTYRPEVGVKRVFEYVESNNMIGPVVVHVPPSAFKEPMLGYAVNNVFKQLLKKNCFAGGYAVALGAFVNESSLEGAKLSTYKTSKCPKCQNQNKKKQKDELEDEAFFMKIDTREVFRNFKGVGAFKLFAFVHIETGRESLDLKAYLLEDIANKHPVIRRWKSDLLHELSEEPVDVVKGISMVFSDICNSERTRAYLLGQALLGYCLENRSRNVSQSMSVMKWPFFLRTEVNPIIPTLDMTVYRRVFGDKFKPETLYKVLSIIAGYGTITNVSPTVPNARFLPDLTEGLITSNKIIYDKILPPRERTENVSRYFDVYNQVVDKGYLTFVENHVVKRVSEALASKIAGGESKEKGFRGKFVPAIRVITDAVGMVNQHLTESKPVVRLWYPPKKDDNTPKMSFLAIPNAFEVWSVLQNPLVLKKVLAKAKRNYLSRRTEVYFSSEEQEKACEQMLKS